MKVLKAPSLVDVLQVEILALGYCIIGSTNLYNVGDIVPIITRVDQSEQFTHPFRIMSLATEAEIQACLASLEEAFPGCGLTARPPARYWYKCMTD